MKKRNEVLEFNLLRVPLLMFLESYNQSIPKSFPHATIATLEKFRGLYPTLFKSGNKWSIAQHRKRLMDWLSSSHIVS